MTAEGRCVNASSRRRRAFGRPSTCAMLLPVSDGTEARGREAPARTHGENAFTPGTVIDGKFRIERTIGVGGMGTVLAAHHIGLDKAVALKVLVDNVGDRSAIQRLVREARAVAQLESAGVARVLDVGSTASGAPYIVMERLVGMDFGALLRVRGTLRVDEAARYIIEACAPLEEAHGVGIVHRDLKPQNLFLAETKPGRKVVKVLDFGISRVDPKSDDRDERLTAQHELLGTPRYMPPEQLAGARNADARSDVYSLGACLYHFVSGKPPIAAGTLSTMLASIRTVVPERLDALRSDVPRGFADIVARCLEKSPQARFQSIQAVREALGPFAAEPSARVAEAASHLDDDAILAMQDGRLAPAALGRAQAHLAACGECRELVAFAAASSADEPAGSASAESDATRDDAVATVTLELSDTAIGAAPAALQGDGNAPTFVSAQAALVASVAPASPTLKSGEPRSAAPSAGTFQAAIASVDPSGLGATRATHAGGRGGLWTVVAGGAVLLAVVATLGTMAVVRRGRVESASPTSASSAVVASDANATGADAGAGAVALAAPVATEVVASPSAAVALPSPPVPRAAAARGTTRGRSSAGPGKGAVANPIGAGIPDER